MAMLPFCGYNFADYWRHWLEIGAKLTRAPKIYHVNWFRRDREGRFLWPGYGENLRVLAWLLERCTVGAGAVETPIGSLPRPADLNMQGLKITGEALDALFSVDRALWRQEVSEIGEYFARFGARVPSELLQELKLTQTLLGASS